MVSPRPFNMFDDMCSPLDRFRPLGRPSKAVGAPSAENGASTLLPMPVYIERQEVILPQRPLLDRKLSEATVLDDPRQGS